METHPHDRKHRVSFSVNDYQATGALDRLSNYVLNFKFRLFKSDHRGEMFADDGIRRRPRRRGAD
jgi:hypothetical protein